MAQNRLKLIGDADELVREKNELLFEQLIEMKLDPFHVGGVPHVSLQVVNSDENAAFVSEKDNSIFGCSVGNLLQEPYCLVESQGFALT